MEAKGRKMLAIGVIIGLCAVAMIGAAYAAFGGTASTYNEGNSAKADYLVFNNTTWTPMVNKNAEFSTYTYQDATPATAYAYYLDDAVAIGDTDYVGISLMTATKDITLTNKTTAAVEGITFSAHTVAAIGSADFAYILKVTVGTAAEISGETAQIVYIVFDNTAAPAAENIELTSSIAANGNVTVKMELYIGYEVDVDIPAGFIGPAVPIGNEHPSVTGTGAKTSANAPVPLSAVGFGFSATGWDPQ